MPEFDEKYSVTERIEYIVDALIGLDLEEVRQVLDATYALCKLTMEGADA